MDTIGTITSRIRNVIKATRQDAFVTDRILYSIAMKYGKMLIKREDNRNKIMRYNSIFKPLPCVELIESDLIEACCSGIQTNCTIMRTKEKLPGLMEGTFGPLIRTISSIDGSVEVLQTEPGTYRSMTKTTSFKYNTTKYYWYLNGYLYFPNIPWEAVRVEGIFEDSIGVEQCETDQKCLVRQDQEFPIPDYLFAEMEQLTLKELGFQVQFPTDQDSDKQDPIRS